MDKQMVAPAAARRAMLGMTLIELMTVVMIMAVIITIAVPGYQNYQMRARRTEAKTALLQLQTNQERFYLTNRTYGTVAQLVAANLLRAGGLSEQGTYTITIAGASATGYTATARPTSGADFDMTGDGQCTEFTINAQGVRGAAGSQAASCW